MASSQTMPTFREITNTLATELALDYASLKAAGNCPTGMYLTPSQDSLLLWEGVSFIHKGPYASSILHFTLSFPDSYPEDPPHVKFGPDVFHPQIDPRTGAFKPAGQLAKWRPHVHHVTHLLHHIKSSFKTQALQKLAEEDVVNHDAWLMLHQSREAFLNLLAQHASVSSSRSHLYSNSAGEANPA